MNTVGEPYRGKPDVRFDEGGLAASPRPVVERDAHPGETAGKERAHLLDGGPDLPPTLPAYSAVPGLLGYPLAGRADDDGVDRAWFYGT